jgi:hypothetical protein
MIIPIHITPELRLQADTLYPFGSLKNSITNGKNSIYGSIGEVAVAHYLVNTLRYKVYYAGAQDYDLLVAGNKIEVKTAKVTGAPKDNYRCNVSCHNTTQGCQYYIFVRVMDDMSIAYILGYITPRELYITAELRHTGEYDANGFYFKSDCYSILINKLHGFKKLPD